VLKYDMCVRVRDSAFIRGISSVGRVLRSHRRGQGFESPILHLIFIAGKFELSACLTLLIA
jgi:hypothetical protein